MLVVAGFWNLLFEVVFALIIHGEDPVVESDCYVLLLPLFVPESADGLLQTKLGHVTHIDPGQDFYLVKDSLVSENDYRRL